MKTFTLEFIPESFIILTMEKDCHATSRTKHNFSNGWFLFYLLKVCLIITSLVADFVG